VSDGGIVRCVNPDTGEDIWFNRLSGDYSASPLESEGHLYFCGQNGTCTVLQAGDEFRELAKNKLDADFMAPRSSGQGSVSAIHDAFVSDRSP
jgi:outer membrane protein assembly factor BamB